MAKDQSALVLEKSNRHLDIGTSAPRSFRKINAEHPHSQELEPEMTTAGPTADSGGRTARNQKAQVALNFAFLFQFKLAKHICKQHEMQTRHVDEILN